MNPAAGLEDLANWSVLGDRIKAGNVKSSFGEHIYVFECISVCAYNLQA